MKKIIATVLAMVMALALCTTAFAAVNAPDAKLWRLTEDKKVDYTTNHGEGDVVKHTDAKEYNDAGNVEYWEYWTEANHGYVYIECAQKDATHAIAVKQGFETYVKEYALSETVVKAAVVNYYDIVTEQGKTSEKASCTAPHYLTDGYLDGEGNFYVKGSGERAFNVKLKGTQTIVSVVKAGPDDVIYASCVLGEAKKNADKGWYEATCLVCGKTYALTDDLSVLAKNSIKKDDTTPYYQFNALCVIGDNNNTGKYAFVTGQKFADSYDYSWAISAAANTTKPADGTSSPKTFDAGIAMYVGMALTSVAGSALVIGKKKEF